MACGGVLIVTISLEGRWIMICRENSGTRVESPLIWLTFYVCLLGIQYISIFWSLRWKPAEKLHNNEPWCEIWKNWRSIYRNDIFSDNQAHGADRVQWHGAVIFIVVWITGWPDALFLRVHNNGPADFKHTHALGQLHKILKHSEQVL